MIIIQGHRKLFRQLGRKALVEFAIIAVSFFIATFIFLLMSYLSLTYTLKKYIESGELAFYNAANEVMLNHAALLALCSKQVSAHYFGNKDLTDFVPVRFKYLAWLYVFSLTGAIVFSVVWIFSSPLHNG